MAVMWADLICETFAIALCMLALMIVTYRFLTAVGVAA